MEYHAKAHEQYPHIVKFSGGRSSGMMLLELARSGILDAARGDVVIFNNTSAEHPKTYDFVKRCKDVIEGDRGIPFFWLEFQTYEDLRGEVYKRIPSFRLVNDRPFSVNNPYGYKWRGEVFEELLSFKNYVPTFFRRICTQHMKIETTKKLLAEWFAGKPGLARLGHDNETSLITHEMAYEQHLKHRGSTPATIYANKKEYLTKCAVNRPAQLWSDYSSAAVPFSIHDSSEHISFLGLRHDEKRRVRNVKSRADEYVYTPLDDMCVTSDDVIAFWEAQKFDLELHPDDQLSNCTFCFLKGSGNLKKAHDAINRENNPALINTPSDLNWWVALEEKYARDRIAEKRAPVGRFANSFFGFFGATTGVTYRVVASDMGRGNLELDLLPCDCTD